MKTERILQPATILLTLIFISVFGIAVSSDAQKVHALLILLGNDRKIEESVAKNEEKMVNMLRQLSHHCKVQLTLMYSKSAHEGIVSHKTFVNGRSEKSTTNEQDIIESHQVAEWLGNLTPNAEDTVLIYYSGHGEIDSFGTHSLVFDPGLNEDTPDRGKLSQKLNQKPARLRMLITDTCSNLSQDLSDDTFAKFAVGVRSKARAYMQDLFLEHEGFLDITAASPGQIAIGADDLGGFFTSALLSQGFTTVADTDRDNFLSWQEAFDKAVAQTRKLFQEATFKTDITKGQKTQEPFAHSLPTRIGGGSGLPVQPPPPIQTVAVLNFTSVPSGAVVSIDGFIVGQTPLRDYELETDGRSTKDIEVTVRGDGYAAAVEKFKVRKGHPFTWEFKLTKDMPKRLTGRDGAEMVLIPAGEFQMGSDDPEADDDEKPVHTVYVDAFYMDKYEVTNAQYKKFVLANPRWQKDRIDKRFHDGDYLKHWKGNEYPSGKARHPVSYVSWYAAMAYAGWAQKRLPTEAEWEKAARGGLVGKKYSRGDVIDLGKANYGGNVASAALQVAVLSNESSSNYDSNVGATTVGKYPPNGYGLYDMAGNVWEWCLDEWDEDFYSVSPRENPLSGANTVDWVMNNFTGVKKTRVSRGGSWASNPENLRVAYRNGDAPTFTYLSNGFRCARSQ